MRRAARGFRKYKDKDGNYIFLDDVVSDKNPDVIDNNKLPKELKDCKEFSFVWHDEMCNYILCVKKDYKGEKSWVIYRWDFGISNYRFIKEIKNDGAEKGSLFYG